VKKTFYISTLLLTILFGNFCLAQQTEIDSIKRVLRVTKIDTAKVNLYNKLADKFKESNPDSTGVYANKAALLSQKVKYNFGLASSFINSGNSNIILGNYKKALSYFQKAEKSFENQLNSNSEIDIKRIQNGLARAYASQGVVYSEQSNYFMSLEKYQKALKIYIANDQKNNIAKAYNNIGIVYKAQGNSQKALEFFQKALPIQHQIGEQSEAVTLTNIGLIYFEKGDMSKSFLNYMDAKKLFEKNDNKRGFALLHNYLGDYAYKDGNDFKAGIEYNYGLELYEAMQNKHGASLVLYNLGQMNYELKNYIEALKYAQKSLAYAKEVDVLDQTFHSEKLISEIYAAQNNPTKSLEHYKNYIVARDSITNQENNKKFVRAEMDFEYKKKEALFAEQSKRQTQFTIFSILATLLVIGLILLAYNRMQVKKRLTLQKEVAEYEQKALHLQMNPHFVFNCLGSISSFIVQNGTDSALKYLSKFSKLMRLTLEYSKGALIPIDKEIESLQNYLELEQLRFHNKFIFNIKASDKVEFNMGIPPLLIQPFVENAILHGMVPKEGNGKIDVNFDVHNSQLICTITDDGIGLAKSKHLKENSVTAHKSMALEITKKRLEIMEATTSKSAQIDIKELITNNQISGTCVTMQLPIQYIQ
jgi:tetratricopeptide (TPR) repeat protein